VLDWIGLLAGCVAFGASVVAALVLPRTLSPISAVTAVGALYLSLTSFGSIANRYDTGKAIGFAVVVFIAGIAVGYAIGASSLAYLQRRPRRITLRPSGGDLDGIVLVGCCDPERYSPAAIALRQDLLINDAELEVPVSAIPFIFMAEKARYRSIGGRSPGPASARRLATRLLDRPELAAARLELAWCYEPGSLARAVARVHDAGANRVAMVPLGLPVSAQLDAAVAHLGEVMRDSAEPAVRMAPTVWHDRVLPERMAERIIAATAGMELRDVGVVLVGQGVPPVWERRYAEAAEAETYFNQRVRTQLGEAGIDEQHVRMCWIDWQAPDVTESARHLAALGCTRVIVAPSTIALPTLETALDLGHALAMARVPNDVQLVTLQPWGDDDGFVEAVARSARAALEEIGRTRAEG
jgi:protoheme ferro-lyase